MSHFCKLQGWIDLWLDVLCFLICWGPESESKWKHLCQCNVSHWILLLNHGILKYTFSVYQGSETWATIVDMELSRRKDDISSRTADVSDLHGLPNNFSQSTEVYVICINNRWFVLIVDHISTIYYISVHNYWYSMNFILWIF